MKWIVFILVLFSIAGCESLSNRHATRALLLTEKPPTGEKVTHQEFSLKHPKYGKFYSGNPIFIHNNTKFSIKIDEISAGWIYKKSPDNSQSAENGYGDLSLPNYDPDITSHEDFNHFRGIDLWLLTTISSLNPNDPLETKSKRYFKATNVKFDSQSYSFLPIDSDERYVFTHESDLSYRIKFQLYSVKGFAVKRELSKIASNPGVWGVGSAVLTTLKNTFGSIAGDVIASTWNEKVSEDLAMERFLLSAGATEELHANLVVIRRESFESRGGEIEIDKQDVANIKKTSGNTDIESQLIPFKKGDKYSFPLPLKKTSYVALDYFKEIAPDNNAKEVGKDSQDKKMFSGNNLIVTKEGKVKIENDARSLETDLTDFTYLKFTVVESDSTQKFVDEVGNIKSTKGAAYFKNNVIPLLTSINTNKVTSLQAKLETAQANKDTQCPGNNCAPEVMDARLKEITHAKIALDKAAEEHKAGLSTIENINKLVSMEEWIEHIQKQAD